MKAIVIGGGIGGMAAALSLRNEGIEVEVYEQAPALTEIGAGLQIAPSAGRVLERLGLGAELERLAITMERLQMHDLRSDRLIHSVSPKWGGPFYQLHRPDLLGMLGDALPPGVVRLGERAAGFVEEVDLAGHAVGRELHVQRHRNPGVSEMAEIVLPDFAIHLREPRDHVRRTQQRAQFIAARRIESQF